MAKKKSKGSGGGGSSDKKAAEESKSDRVPDDNNGGGGDGSDDGGAAGAGEETSSYVEDELELLQVDLGDMIKMKQVLDEAVAGTVLEHVEEDYHWDNIKLLVMTLACGFAMVAQFAPLPFPESRPILGVCGTLYFVLSGVLQFITIFVDRDTILITKSDIKSDNDQLQKYGIRVRSNLPRFSEFYEVTLEFNIPDNKKKGSGDGDEQQQPKNKQPPPSVKQSWSVGQFFDKEGYFDEIGVMDEIDKLFKRLEDGEYDKTTDEKKNQ